MKEKIDYHEKLRQKLWDESIGTSKRVINRTYCTVIRDKVLSFLNGGRDEKKIILNWETVRDFLNIRSGVSTSLLTLNKFSAFVLNDKELTFQHFKELCKTQANPQTKTIEDSKTKSAKPKIIALILGIAFLISCVLFMKYLFLHSVEDSFSESFDDINKNSLLTGEWNGWKVNDIDSFYLEKQEREGMLTLFTLEGDYWIDKRFNEEPIIKNFLYRQIHCDACEVNLLIRGFYPNMAWQQVSIFFLKNLMMVITEKNLCDLLCQEILKKKKS